MVKGILWWFSSICESFFVKGSPDRSEFPIWCHFPLAWTSLTFFVVHWQILLAFAFLQVSLLCLYFCGIFSMNIEFCVNCFSFSCLRCHSVASWLALFLREVHSHCYFASFYIRCLFSSRYFYAFLFTFDL